MHPQFTRFTCTWIHFECIEICCKQGRFVATVEKLSWIVQCQLLKMSDSSFSRNRMMIKWFSTMHHKQIVLHGLSVVWDDHWTFSLHIESFVVEASRSLSLSECILIHTYEYGGVMRSVWAEPCFVPFSGFVFTLFLFFSFLSFGFSWIIKMRSWSKNWIINFLSRRRRRLLLMGWITTKK